MPTFYNFRENGLDYSFDDIFVPADLFRDGNLWTWGDNNSGQLGNNTTINVSTPVTTSTGGTNWKQVSAGGLYTVAIKTDGTLWILNSIPVTFFAGNDWKQANTYFVNVVAIKTDGTLWVWGSGADGQLGTNDTTDALDTPVTTFAGGTNWKQVSGGVGHTAAIKTDGTLWTWGNGSYGRLGNASTTNVSTPVTTFAGGNNWKQVSCGAQHTAAIKTDGTLWTWGRNYGGLANGMLGNNNTTDVSTPVTTFAGGNNWKQVSGGFTHTAAIKTDGTLWAWGLANSGQLGDRDTFSISFTFSRLTPVTTFAGGTNWKQVSCGNAHTAAIKTDGTLWTWGSGSKGQLGNAVTTIRSTPVTTFAGGTNWKQVSSGGDTIAAVTYIDPVI